jgi:hypothetical protein
MCPGRHHRNGSSAPIRRVLILKAGMRPRMDENRMTDTDTEKSRTVEGAASDGPETATDVDFEATRRAMATYSSDGQGDDSTGGDALAEVWRERQGTTGRAE